MIDHPMIGDHRAGDRDHLLHAQAELPKRTPDVDLDAVPRNARGGLAMHPRSKSMQSEPVKGLAPRNRFRATLSSGTRFTSW